MTTHGYTAAESPLSAGAADQVTYDQLEDMDDCPVCGGTLGGWRRRHVCREPRDIPRLDYHDHGRPT